MGLQIYGDFMSQPSRAMWIFARANQIQYEEKVVQIIKAEHKTPEFKAINPMGKLPAMTDEGFNLFESHAMLRYLASTRNVADHWYPADPKKRATVDCILDWHHSNLRKGSAELIREKVFAQRGLFGRKPDEEKIRTAHIELVSSLDFIENIWLTGEAPFLAGACQPSIADLSLACEVLQSELLDRSEREAIMGPREKIRNWVKAVEDSLAPHFTDVHALIRMVSSKSQSKRDAQKRQSAL